jgi:catechol 2,3-dioxygenase-like lactoylglutathione lyase family enzyme
MGAQLQIDHVTIAGLRLDGIREAFTSATGIPTEFGGRHTNHATEMALVSFPNGSYLELMGIQRDADPAAVAHHVWSRFLRGDAGPCAFAISAGGVQLDQLRSAGIQIEGPERGGRTRPDGTRLEWESTELGSGPRGTFFPFLIRDLTPRTNRVYPSGRPTTDRVSGISKVVIGVQSLNDAIALYRRAFGLPVPRRQRDSDFDAELAWFERTPIVLAQGLNAKSWLTRRVAQYGDLPSAFVVGAAEGQTGAHASDWFGHKIYWADEHKLGWRLGMEVSR